jgi:Ni,Fe-hydrogenase III small subunit
MIKILSVIRRVGIISEPVRYDANDPEWLAVGTQVQSEIVKQFSGSLAIRQVDAGSCNACELEIHAINNPYYAISRFGVHFVASPRHADMLLVTGVVSRHMETALLRTYQATPAPKLVIAAGDCAANGGEFGISYASCGAVSQVLPVDAVILGCPPTPLALLKGILGVLKRRK